MTDLPEHPIVIIISANTEWRVIRIFYPDAQIQTSPLGEWFVTDLDVQGRKEPVIFFHGGWGKIAAAASAQYIIDRWSPALLVNLGTCGGIEGEVEKGAILLVERTIVYDIIEQMNDAAQAIAHYSTTLDLSWLGKSYPHEVQRTLLVSADRDLVKEEVSHLKTQFGAIAGDWESGAIAYVAQRNHTRCLILRGVSDLVSPHSGEAYGKPHIFAESTTDILRRLIDALPAWLASISWP